MDGANYAWVNRVPFAIGEGASGNLVNTSATDFEGVALVRDLASTLAIIVAYCPTDSYRTIRLYFLFRGVCSILLPARNTSDLANSLYYSCDDVIENPATAIFAKAKAFKAVSYPGSGHGLNLAANATGSFQIITDFLGSNGL